MKVFTGPANNEAKGLDRFIDEYGWAVAGVDASDTYPGYAYSVGLAALGHSEIIVFGLSPLAALDMINNVAFLYVNKRIRREAGGSHHNLADNLPITFLQVDADQINEWMPWACEKASKDFSALQMICPDTNGKFPWEENCDERIRLVQPLLGPAPQITH